MPIDFTRYDQRGYPTVDVREGYRRWSATYDQRMGDELDIWLLDRLSTVSWAVDGVADLVVNVLAAEHLPDLGPLYAEMARLCRPRATAVVVGYHPHFLLNGIPTHFPHGDGQLAIENTIHLFADHVRAARTCGLTLRELEERVVDDEMVARVRGYQRHAGRPVSFAMVWNAA